MHSSINIANEYVSEFAVGETTLPSRISMAERLTESPDDTVLETVFSMVSSTIIVIVKSQISASPLPECGQSAARGSDLNVEFTSGEISTFVYTPPVNRLSQGCTENLRI